MAVTCVKVTKAQEAEDLAAGSFRDWPFHLNHCSLVSKLSSSPVHSSESVCSILWAFEVSTQDKRINSVVSQERRGLSKSTTNSGKLHIFMKPRLGNAHRW